ncbi:MAG: PAS domain-containing protein [Desulfobacter sp.]|nr:MAG: PAS domain-containing protein [Desulfobacter sp.]
MDMVSDINTIQGLLKVIDTLPVAVSVINGNRRVVLANRAIARLTNKKNEELLGKVGGEALGCIHKDDSPLGCGFGPDCVKCRLRQSLETTLETKEPLSMVETTMAFKGGNECHLRISTLPLVLNQEDVVLLSIEDITDIKAHEQTRMEKEKMAAAVQTAGAVCHEINQPLMVIMGMAEILLEDIPSDDPRHAQLTEIKIQADRLGDITKQLMTLTEYRTKPYLKKQILDIKESSDGSV